MKLSFAIALAVAAVLAGCTTPSAVIVGTPRPALAVEAVRVYDTAPPGAEVIARISAVGQGLTYNGAAQNALAVLKKRAAALGANGLVIDTSEQRIWEGHLISARAVFVPATP